ncbi:MAG: IS1182 family transposase [Gammaproteobacteria bacterium]|nr:IS1182 family transposase [Gammaproteobacteria bacterium]
MTRFIEGEARTQATLFPEALDEYITEENPVRVIDVFVDGLGLASMGFKVLPADTGAPSYHPSTMLKLFIYGYLNRIQSSRRLERESGRNVELMWLLGRLAPDFKTIADFRKNNTKAITQVCREFVLICRKLDLFAESLIAIDGSKFKAVNNRNRNFTEAKIKLRLKQIDESIARYLGQIASADRVELSTAKAKTERLEKKIIQLKKEVEQLNKIQTQLKDIPDKQISLTDPDARSMATSGRGTGMVAYNVQAAVDSKHHLIVAHEVTNRGHDRAQLFNMADQAKTALETEALTVVADRGYYSGEEIKACDDAGITTYLAKPQTSGNQSKGYFGKRDFIYYPEDDEYECPAGERAIYRFSREEKDKVIKRYWSSECIRCKMKSQCTTSKYRRISRWEHEAILDRLEDRMEREPDMMKVRRCTVEHPFGTVKHWMGSTHFQMKTINRVSAEMSLHVLGYNLKRVINILGTRQLMEAMQA